MFAPYNGVAMGIAKEEGRLGAATMMQGGHGGHLATNDGKGRGFGGIGHPSNCDYGTTAIAGEGDVGGLAFALATAVVTCNKEEVAGTVV